MKERNRFPSLKSRSPLFEQSTVETYYNARSRGGGGIIFCLSLIIIAFLLSALSD